MRGIEKNRPTGAPNRSKFFANWASRAGRSSRGDADRGVELLARGEAAAPPRLAEAGRIDRELGALARRVGGEAGADLRLQRRQRRAGQHVDMPGLEVAARRRPAGERRGFRRPSRDRPAGRERPDRAARQHRLRHRRHAAFSPSCPDSSRPYCAPPCGYSTKCSASSSRRVSSSSSTMTARNIATARPIPFTARSAPGSPTARPPGTSPRTRGVGAGEAYMDGRLVVEPPHDIRDLVLLIRYNAPFEKPGALKPKGPITPRRQFHHRQARPDQLEEPLAPQRRAYLQPHPPPLRALPRRGPPIYLRLFPRPQRQPRTGAARQEGAHRRQAEPEARHEGARHRLRLGRPRALSAPPLRRRRARRRAGARPDRVRQRARRRSGRLRPGQVRAQGLSRRRRPVRPDHQRRPDRASRHAALSGLLRADAPSC